MAIGDSKFIATNIVTGGAVLINGTGGYSNPPTLVQNADFPLSNVLTEDRYTTWRWPTGTSGTATVDFDLGGDVTVLAAGVAGMKRSGTATWNRWRVYYKTAATGYDGGGGATVGWTPYGDAMFGAASPVLRDAIVEGLGAGQFWRFQSSSLVTSATAFSVGKFVLAASVVDLGIASSPGLVTRRVRPSAIEQTVGGVFVRTGLGMEHALLSVPFRTIQRATLDKIVGLFYGSGSKTAALYITPTGLVYEVVPRGDELEYTMVWADGTNELYDAMLELEGMA